MLWVGKARLESAVLGELQKTKDNKMLKVVIILLFVGQVVLAKEKTENSAAEDIQQDECGCAMIKRPDELTFRTFRDAWRSIAAEKLYSLRGHEAAVACESCNCGALRPEWATIM